MNLRGKDLICTQDWNIDELMTILNTAIQMKWTDITQYGRIS